MAWLYIIFSKQLNKFYVGITQDSPEARLNAHNQGKYGNAKFTATTHDWEMKLTIPCDDYAHATRLEKKIKSMKSRTYIKNLMKYEELREKILNKTR
ncbi:GIY-YIG nuclease family protein [uncultured Nonlabens sp.]|uniref:GIY-YIG nuclease family protein n=1 Tax=uncultured Nonlabens sp. TaxID=859306 RepID=UPI002606BCB5|nr:GIY-YIG nuclease family protein [uncultured Nonlabens sp.]